MSFGEDITQDCEIVCVWSMGWEMGCMGWGMGCILSIVHKPLRQPFMHPQHYTQTPVRA